MTKPPAAKDPTRNVWLQLGFPDAEEHFLKAELVLRLDKAITSLGLTQRAAARRIGATQPELSKILGGKFTEVSLERLMRFLTALGCHIEIKIGAGQENKAGDVTIKDVRRTAALSGATSHAVWRLDAVSGGCGRTKSCSWRATADEDAHYAFAVALWANEIDRASAAESPTE